MPHTFHPQHAKHLDSILFGPPKQERISPQVLKKLLEETGFTKITVTKLTMFTFVAVALKQ